jgi:hypothetical protein
MVELGSGWLRYLGMQKKIDMAVMLATLAGAHNDTYYQGIPYWRAVVVFLCRASCIVSLLGFSRLVGRRLSSSGPIATTVVCDDGVAGFLLYLLVGPKVIVRAK